MGSLVWSFFLKTFYRQPRETRLDPFVLTALMDPIAALRFDAQRRAYFPAKRNHVPAHCTLFHQLPGEREEAVREAIARACAAAVPFTAMAAGLLDFGRGVAYALEAPRLVALRHDLAMAFGPWLSEQDRQRYRPHVTIQNKADPAQARRLLASLEDDFAPFFLRIEGLSLWRYRGGPWDAAGTFRFGRPVEPAAQDGLS